MYYESLCMHIKLCYWILCFFFFSSRRRHTRCSRDWSSDVCSSDLILLGAFGASSREPLLYVSNEIPNTISVVSPRTNAVIATVPVGKRPRGMALSPDRRTVYVALGQDDALGVVDVASGQMTRAIPANP